VLCEKPLAGDARQARDMLDAANRAGVTHACGFNYRFVPAVRLARQLVEAGRFGALRHFRAVYLQDRAAALHRSPQAMGAAGEYAHLIDLLRHFAGDPLDVSASTVSFGSEREDGYVAALRLPARGLASLEASRYATGWKGRQRIELNGTEGSAVWNMEDLNRLRLFFSEDERAGMGGFRNVLVTEPQHPFLAEWWTPGHGLGWDASFVHQWRAFLAAVLEHAPVEQHQADFHDGYRAAVITDAVLRAADEGRRIALGPAT
jgi:predicted dehydrogenase